ncbi:hypothetical protein N9L56_00485 [Gammaproteobacteria bacterium]|nr:hypothetical protein [Gammaproteobacteria bacterium]
MKNFIFVILFILSQSSFGDNLSNCNFKTGKYLDKLNNFNEINAIEVKVNDYRKWTKNTLEAFISKDTSITSKYKKKFPAVVNVKYSFGECSHKARVRLHGDWKDHINFERGGKLNQSIDVSLQEGSIANIIKFKLLLPITRRYENEIILTKLLRITDFVAPRTSLVPVVINGTSSEMLFQEKAAKELVEGMDRREGPLFEGDERFLFNNFNDLNTSASHLDLENISLSKITNDNWASSNYVSAYIALNSFSQLQKTYMTYGRDLENYILDWKILSHNNEGLIDKWAMYEMLLFAANSSHALIPHNRKFFYNSLESGFEPVYFDGNPREIDTRWIRQMPDFSKYRHLKNEHFESLYQIIKSLSPKVFAEQMEGNLYKPSTEKTEAIINNLLIKILRLQVEFNNLNSIEQKLKKPDESISIKESLKDNIRKSIPNSRIINIENLTSDKNLSYFPASVCLVDENSCKGYQIEIFEIGKMLERKKLSNLEIDAHFFIAPPALNQYKTKTKIFMGGDIKLKSSINTVLNFNIKTKTLIIELLTHEDWALIKESNLEDITIKLLSKIDYEESTLSPVRINQFGLTGCLTFYKSSFNNSKILANAKNTNCEDIVNIMNSNGDIQSLKISNASADGLDLDFSNINIENVSILNAKNDCADFSQGNYKIESGIFKNCGDKGISVGEKSTFLAKNLQIASANVGISSKDSSISNVSFLKVNEGTICAEAFQKKQEFFGSNLKISNLVCNSKILNQDTNSFITVL